MFASASFICSRLGACRSCCSCQAIALSTVTGIDVYVSICMMGVMATLYTVLGGIEAVIWTDVVQVFVLLGGALLSLVVILGDIDGGLGGLIAQGTSADKFHVFNWSWDYTTAAVWVVLVGNLFNNLVPYTSDQAVVQRYLTTKDERSAARGVWLNALMIIPSTMMLFLLGTGLWAFYRARPELLSPSLPTDSIFPLFLSQQLPAGLAGLVIAGVFAASMSTLDSSLNSVATAITADFYGRLNPEADDRRKLRLAKALTALLGAAATGTAIALASLEIGSLWDAFQGMMELVRRRFGGTVRARHLHDAREWSGRARRSSHECRGAGLGAELDRPALLPLRHGRHFDLLLRRVSHELRSAGRPQPVTRTDDPHARETEHGRCRLNVL
ncbi:MAG: hypothetical protein R2748_03210 [Bryobacterales bacterium]